MTASTSINKAIHGDPPLWIAVVTKMPLRFVKNACLPVYSASRPHDDEVEVLVTVIIKSPVTVPQGTIANSSFWLIKAHYTGLISGQMRPVYHHTRVCRLHYSAVVTIHGAVSNNYIYNSIDNNISNNINNYSNQYRWQKIIINIFGKKIICQQLIIYQQ